MARKHQVGDIRPSQLLFTYGVGSIIDLPHLSTLVMGIDDWNTQTNSDSEIKEPRLLQALQSVMGPQLQRLLAPPIDEDSRNQFSTVGVPVVTFPRWMVCPYCHLLAPIDDHHFTLKANPYRPDRVYYHHETCAKRKNGKPPTVVPSRFMIACDAGHLDDFPWHHFLHGDKPCKAIFNLYELGVSGEPSDISVRCETCGANRKMADAFNSFDETRTYRPMCTHRSPHLRKYTKGKAHEAKTILRSASNTWFPLVYNTLSIPEGTDPLEKAIEDQWFILQGARSFDILKGFFHIPSIQSMLGEYSLEEVWSRVERKLKGADAAPAKPSDLKTPEWRVLTDPLHAPRTDDFSLEPLETIPEGYEEYIEQVVLVDKLREVLALTGFTRIESLSDYTEEEELPRNHIMKLSSKPPIWLPAVEVRGEGIFIQFREKAIQHWLQQATVQYHNDLFFGAHRRWRESRHLDDYSANYPGMRYNLLHTFSHALMRQLTLECGYAAASIRERIYALPPEAEDGPMAGILLYTAASDSEGTLGGLVHQGKQLGFHIGGALDDMEYCASDPLCAEHVSLEDNSLHGAACHSCMFAPETSCERGNKYLDRSLLTRTVERGDLAFFQRTEN